MTSETDHRFAVRVQRTGTRAVRAYARGQAFDVGSQASLREADSHPSAVEYALGALGGDLLLGLDRAAESAGLRLHAAEIALNGRLDNILAHLGVVGEAGHPGFSAIGGSAYVSLDADPAAAESIWQSALARSPLYNTLTRCVTMSIALRVVP